MPKLTITPFIYEISGDKLKIVLETDPEKIITNATVQSYFDIFDRRGTIITSFGVPGYSEQFYRIVDWLNQNQGVWKK